MKKKRLIAFFPWSRYFDHFIQPIFEPMTDEYECIFLHSDHAIYRYAEDKRAEIADTSIQGMDLSDLKTYSFVTALKKLQPDCVIVIDKGWVQDRALLHAALHLGIPTLQIQHGMVAIQDDVKTNAYGKRLRTEFMKIIRTFWLYDITLLHISFLALLKSIPYQLLLFINPTNYYHNHRTEVIADRACIIGRNDLEFFTGREGYTEDQLDIVGSIFFDKTYKLRKENAGGNEKNQVLYLSQPLYEDHFLMGEEEAKRQHYLEILEAIRTVPGLKLAVKPHPREDVEIFTSLACEELVVYPRDADLDHVILENKYVMGCCSTAMINALILRKPIGVIRWIDDRWYNMQLDTDGVAVTLNSPGDIKKLVESGGLADHADVDSIVHDCDVVDEIRRSISRVIEGTG